jgi:hypothetical protein
MVVWVSLAAIIGTIVMDFNRIYCRNLQQYSSRRAGDGGESMRSDRQMRSEASR